MTRPEFHIRRVFGHHGKIVGLLIGFFYTRIQRFLFGIFLAEELEHLLGLLRAVTNYHAANTGIIERPRLFQSR